MVIFIEWEKNTGMHLSASRKMSKVKITLMNSGFKYTMDKRINFLPYHLPKDIRNGFRNICHTRFLKSK